MNEAMKRYSPENRMMLHTIGENIKHRMTERRMTQTELGSKCGIHQTRISIYVNGKQEMTVTTLIRICKALDCDVRDLLAGVDV